MDIDQLEKLLRKYYKKVICFCRPTVKAQIKRETLQAFSRNHTPQQSAFLKRHIWWMRFSKLAFVSAIFVVLFNVFPFSKSEILAGSLNPTNGVVKIVRDNRILLVSEEIILQEGDVVEIGHNGEAEIFFPDQFKSTLLPRTELTIINDDEVFIEQGKIINTSFREHQFSGDRGFVESTPDSQFIISISESGEMEIIAQKNNIHVFDWKSGETKLETGEKIHLRTDTDLSQKNIDIPDNLKLSTTQLRSVQAKLIIARTKLLTTIEEITSGNRDASESDLQSAQKSFLSIIDILHASRNLKISKRTDLNSISFDDILREMQRKKIPQDFIEKAEALTTLFNIVKAHRHHIAFQVPQTPVTSYNRFVTIDRIFQNGNQDHAEILKDIYVVVFLRKILNEPLRIDQISVLNNAIDELPHTPQSSDFLKRLQNILHPDIATILAEKIKREF